MNPRNTAVLAVHCVLAHAREHEVPACYTTATQEAHDASIQSLAPLTRRILSAEELTATLATTENV